MDHPHCLHTAQNKQKTETAVSGLVSLKCNISSLSDLERAVDHHSSDNAETSSALAMCFQT